jgi:hypothetical protein
MNPDPHPDPDPHSHQDFFLDPHPHFFDADPQHCLPVTCFSSSSYCFWSSSIAVLDFPEGV